MSHIKNMQSFEKLTGICTGLGGNYNPGKQNLQVNAMATQLNIAQLVTEEVREARKVYDNATNARELGFKNIRKLSCNVYDMLKVYSTDPFLLADALNSKRRIWGASITRPSAVEPEKANDEKKDSRPSYGRGYVTIAEYFDRLVKTVSSEPAYTPNETRLMVASLQQIVAELFSFNKRVMDAEVRLEESIIKRNTVYYIASQNLLETAAAAKMYVRSVFGFRSQQHEQLRKLRFTKPNL